MTRSHGWVPLLALGLLAPGIAGAGAPDCVTTNEAVAIPVADFAPVVTDEFEPAGPCAEQRQQRARHRGYPARGTDPATSASGTWDEAEPRDVDPIGESLPEDDSGTLAACPCWDAGDVARLVAANPMTGCRQFICTERARYEAGGQLLDLTDARVRDRDLEARLYRERSAHVCTYRSGRIERTVGDLTWDEVVACHELQHRAVREACNASMEKHGRTLDAGQEPPRPDAWAASEPGEDIDGFGRPAPWPKWGSTTLPQIAPVTASACTDPCRP